LFLTQTSVVSGLAVDALTGDIWVGDESRREMQHYDSMEFLIRRFSVLGPLPSGRPGGIALDANGDVWVGDSAANFVQQFTPSGFALAGLGVPASRVGGLAFDVNGDLLVGELGPNTVYRMTTGGALLSATDLNGLSRIGALTAAIPEPSTFLLLALGLTGTVVARRRQS
jgi:streptogramin lyase